MGHRGMARARKQSVWLTHMSYNPFDPPPSSNPFANISVEEQRKLEAGLRTYHGSSNSPAHDDRRKEK